MASPATTPPNIPNELSGLSFMSFALFARSLQKSIKHWLTWRQISILAALPNSIESALSLKLNSRRCAV
jgi:hypothetical protein